MKIYIKLGIMFSFITFLCFFNLNILKAEGAGCNNYRPYTYGDKKINLRLNMIDSGGDNTSADRIMDYTNSNGGGMFWNSANSGSLSKEQLKLNENGEGILKFRASALSEHYISGIFIKITVNGETVSKINDGFEVFWCEDVSDNSGHVDFELSADTEGFNQNDNIVLTLKAETGLKTSCFIDQGLVEGPLGHIGYGGRENCRTSKDFSVDVNIKAFEQASNATSSEEQEEVINNNLTINTTTTSKLNYGSIPGKTSLNAITAGESQKITCDNSLKSFISEIWKYFVIFGPILLIVMVSLDFFKALFSSDSDMLTKAGSNTVKRTISAIILLLLPLIIETILGFFGLELCI